MMIRSLVLSALLMTAGTAVTGQTQETAVRDAVSAIFSEEVSFDVAGGRLEGASVKADRVIFPSELFDIVLDGVELNGSGGDRREVKFTAATLFPKRIGAPAIKLTSGALSLSGAVGNTSACGFSGAIDALSAERILISPLQERAAPRQRQTIPDPSYQLRVSDFSFARAGSPICGISGVLEIGAGSLSTAAGKLYSASALRLQAILPFTQEAGQASGTASLRLTGQDFEYTHAKGIPAAGGSAVSIRADLNTNSMRGLFQVIGAQDFYRGDIDPLYLGLQLFNAATILEGRLDVRSDVLVVYASGALPPSAVANFSRVGLSTLTGSGMMSVELDKGDITATKTLDFVGLGSLKAEMSAFVLPYPSDLFADISAGEEVGLRTIPDIRVAKASLEVTDTGFDSAVQNLTGVPAARYASEIIEQILHGTDSTGANILRTVNAGLTGFLREMAAGNTMKVTFTPARIISISESMILAIRDFDEFVAFFGQEAAVSRN